jgi:hypothetical protein
MDPPAAARKAAWVAIAMQSAFGDRHPQVAQYAIAYALVNAGNAKRARALATPLLPVIDAAFAADAPFADTLALSRADTRKKTGPLAQAGWLQRPCRATRVGEASMPVLNFGGSRK